MAPRIKTENALDRFVARTRELFAREADPEKRWPTLEPALAELLSDPEVLEASATWPRCRFTDNRAENLLFYEDPDYGFAINGLNKAPVQGRRSLIHDHAHIYTLYGLLGGHERMERYQRLDDRSKPDYAKIERTTDRVLARGDIDLVRPYEVHSEVNVGEQVLAVVVRSQKGGSFNQGRYDPETGRYWESLGPRQTPVEMIPGRGHG